MCCTEHGHLQKSCERKDPYSEVGEDPTLEEQKADASVELPWGSQTNPGLDGSCMTLPTTSVRTQENNSARARVGGRNTETCRNSEPWGKATVRQPKQIRAEKYRLRSA